MKVSYSQHSHITISNKTPIQYLVGFKRKQRINKRLFILVDVRKEGAGPSTANV